MTIDERYRFSYGAQRIELEKAKQERIKGHCKDCKHFRELPYYTDTAGKCFQHTGLWPKGDWYCADFEPQERNDKE